LASAHARGDADSRGAFAARSNSAERSLSEEANLAVILRLALAEHPELAEARERAAAARELAPAAARLPDPEFEYELWAQPLARPLALDEAQMHMFGVRQTFPAPGSLDAQSKSASARADVASRAHLAREQDLVARVRRAYAEYYRADREYRIHLEHVLLEQQALDAARAQYQGGRGTQQDVLRVAVELSRLHNDISAIDRDRRTARGLLNTLMARAIESPLGPPAALEPAALDVRLDQLEHLVADRRPEIAAAVSAIESRASDLDAARSTASWPSFMVGLQYMYMPPENDPHNYGVMFSLSLPWLNPRHREEVRAAEAQLAAERSALSSTRYAARYELFEAVERLKAARESFAIIERDLLPQAKQSFESAEAAYRGGQADALGMLDALRSLLDVRLERERALARIETALADTERAVGGPISPPPEKK
jgi:outer membrane protein, heavy metal efflux system